MEKMSSAGEVEQETWLPVFPPVHFSCNFSTMLRMKTTALHLLRHTVSDVISSSLCLPQVRQGLKDLVLTQDTKRAVGCL